MHLLRAATAATVIAGFVTGASIPTAEANRAVERRYRGQIVVLGKRAPMRFRSGGDFARFLRSQRKKDLWPSKKNKQQWQLEFFAFFKRKTRDVEVKVKFFDITEGKRFVAGDSIFLAQRGEQILASNIVLERPRFSINRKYMMYITDARGVALASTTFWLRGKGPRYSGRVTFSDDEAK